MVRVILFRILDMKERLAAIWKVFLGVKKKRLYLGKNIEVCGSSIPIILPSSALQQPGKPRAHDQGKKQQHCSWKGKNQGDVCLNKLHSQRTVIFDLASGFPKDPTFKTIFI